MNGFWLHEDPHEAAKLNRDSHVVATCREMAIMVHAGLALHLPEEEAPDVMYNVYPEDEDTRSRTQSNDIALWAGESRENWKRAFDLVKALNYEFVTRRRKEDPGKEHHKSWRRTLPLWDYRKAIPHGERTPPPQFGPSELQRDPEEYVQFYRDYYRADKVTDHSEPDGMSHWSSPRSVPDFMWDEYMDELAQRVEIEFNM